MARGGFRNFEALNQALLPKQGWRLLDSTQLYVHRYFGPGSAKMRLLEGWLSQACVIYMV